VENFEAGAFGSDQETRQLIQVDNYLHLVLLEASVELLTVPARIFEVCRDFLEEIWTAALAVNSRLNESL